MQFRTFGRRGLAALASTAVVAGALAVPTILAAPAQATTTADVAFSCTGIGSFTYTTDIDLTAQWSKSTGRATLSAELEDFPNGAPGGVSQDDQAQSFKLVTKIDGSTTATNVIASTTADFQGGVPIDVPTLTAAASAKAETLSVVVESFQLVAGTAPSAFTFNCTPAAPVAAMVVPITFPAGSDLNYVCTFSGNKFAYMSNAVVTANKRGTGTRVGVQLEAMPNTSPAFLDLKAQAHTASLGITANGGSATNATAAWTADFKGAVAVVIPKLVADVAGNPASVAVTANAFSLSVGTSTNISCALSAPKVLSSVTVGAPVTASTTTALAASVAANAVTLAATVTPNTAVGKVEFYEGATKVGENAVASGAASISLAGVAVGAHSYTAKFVATEPDDFATSTSSAASVTVAAPGPSAACTSAQGDVTKAQGVVKSAKAKDKKAKAAVKKASSAVKKAKPAKKKAAKAKLAKAKKAAAKAAKALKAANKSLATAQAAVKASC